MVIATVAAQGFDIRISELSSGLLSRDLSETVRVIDCELGQAVILDIMNRIHEASKDWHDPILKLHTPQEIPVPEMHLLDAGTYAIHFNENGSCHIGIDKNFLLEMPNLDAVAFSVAHELGHEVYRKLFDVKPGSKATPVEEMFCDKFGLEVSALAGFSARGAVDAFDYFIRKDEGNQIPEVLKAFMILNDEHLSCHQRWAQVKEDFPGIARLMTGTGTIDDGRALSFLTQSTREALTEIEYISPLTELLKERNFSHQDAKTKCKILLDLIPDISNTARLKEYSAILRHCIAGQIELKDAPILHELTDALLQKAKENDSWRNVFNNFYYFAGGIDQGPHQDARPLGVYRKIAAVVQRTLDSPNSEPPHDSELHEVIELMHYLWGSREAGIVEPLSIKLELPVKIDTAYEAAVDEQTGKKAALLFYTVLNGKGEIRFVDTISLDVLDACIPFIKDSWGSFESNVHTRRRWERDILSYEKFRESPTEFIKNFGEILSPPSNFDLLKEWPSAHPYSALHGCTHKEFPERALAIHNQWCPKVLAHVQRFLSEEPNEARHLIRGLLLPYEYTYFKREKPENVLREELPHSIGAMTYPWDGPLVKFILSNQSLFTRNELIKSLLHVGAEANIHKWEETFKGPIIATSGELVGRIRDKQDPIVVPRRFSDRDHERNALLCEIVTKIVHSERQSSRLSARILDTFDYTADDISIITSERQKEFRAKVRDKIFTSQSRPPQRYYRGLSFSTLVKLVSWGERASMFPSPEEKDIACQVLGKRLQKIRSLTERKKQALAILAIPPSDPDLREIATSCLAEVYRRTHGADDGSERYRTKLLSDMEDDLKYIIPDLTREVTKKTADRVVSQRELSYALRDLHKLQGGTATFFVSAAVKGAETMFNFAGRDVDRSDDCLNFLLSPLSPELINDFQNKMRSWNVIDYKDTNAIAPFLNHEQDDTEATARKKIALYTLHRHFSLLPLDVKAVVLKQILINPKRLHDNGQDTYSHALSYTMDRVFPDDSSSTVKERETRDWCRLFMEAYVLSAHESERGFLLTMMLASSKSGAGKPLRPGQQLKRVLEHLGPAYIKLGQAIHSYPGTPEDIAKDLAELKGMAMIPARWNLFEMIDERMPEDVVAELDHVGPVRGSASFNIVATYRNMQKLRGAFALLRPHALERAQKGFEDLERVVESLITQRPQLSHFRDDAVNIIRHAREMTNTETNMTLGALQHEQAKLRYEGRRYFADGLILHFTTAHWRKYGDGYRTMDEAQGRSFDELPERNFLQIRYKKAIAKAIAAAELESILRGEAFDYDRHERQYHIHRNTIIALDHGGESRNPPTKTDRQNLGLLVSRLISASIEGKDPQIALQESLAELSGQDDYIQHLRKGLLSLSFVFKYLDTRDIAGIFASCVSHESVCNEVKMAVQNVVPADSSYAKFRDLPVWVQSLSTWAMSGLHRVKGPDETLN